MFIAWVYIITMIKNDIAKAAKLAGRSPVTIRRWKRDGVDITNSGALLAYARQASEHSIRYGGARSIGRKGGRATSDAKRVASQKNGKRQAMPGKRLLLQVVTSNDLDLKADTAHLLEFFDASMTAEKQLSWFMGNALVELERRHGLAMLGKIIKASPFPGRLRKAYRLYRGFLGSIPAVSRPNR
jgi:hypothetical protein